MKTRRWFRTALLSLPRTARARRGAELVQREEHGVGSSSPNMARGGLQSLCTVPGHREAGWRAPDRHRRFPLPRASRRAGPPTLSAMRRYRPHHVRYYYGSIGEGVAIGIVRARRCGTRRNSSCRSRSSASESEPMCGQEATGSAKVIEEIDVSGGTPSPRNRSAGVLWRPSRRAMPACSSSPTSTGRSRSSCVSKL